MIARRSFLTGLASLIAAPASVHTGNLMPVKVLALEMPLAVSTAFEGAAEHWWSYDPHLMVWTRYEGRRPKGFFLPLSAPFPHGG